MTTRSLAEKQVLTTGDVARICHVAPRTVSKWFDSGKLRGYRIPGSRDRRIPVSQLAAFLRAHDMPMDALEGVTGLDDSPRDAPPQTPRNVDGPANGGWRLLLVSPRGGEDLADVLDASSGIEVRVARNGFQAGAAAMEFRPHTVLLDAEAKPGEATVISRNIRSTPQLRRTRIVALLGAGQWDQFIGDKDFDACLHRPVSRTDLLDVLTEGVPSGS